MLYRKWRPQTFDDVAEQPQVTVTLKNELKTNRVNHAYLFTGSRGTGKTTCAKILAKAVNCLEPVDGNPCCTCENCKGIESGSILDVVEMDAASNRRIDDIRSLIDEAQFTPAKGKYRVYIIDEVHMLTTEAFNALLKTLEEPPKHVVFILATTEVHKLPATILSRCQRFDFHRISPEAIAQRLRYVAAQEQVEATQEALLLIAAIADGALRDALSLMDRCIGLDSTITAEIVRAAAGLAQKDYLFELVNCCINKNCAKALKIIDTLHKESKDMARLCDELSNHFRSLMLIKTVKKPRELLVMSDDEFDTAVTQSDYMTLAEIVYNMDVLQRSYERMGKSTNNRTELEMAVVKLSSPELDGTNEALVNRISALEKTVMKLSAGGTVSQPAPAIQPKSVQLEKPVVQPDFTETPDNHTPTIPEPPVTVKPAEPSKNIPTQPTAPSAAEPDASVPSFVEEPAAPSVTENPHPAVNPAAKKPVDTDSIYENAQEFRDWPEVIHNLKQYSRAISAAFEGTKAYISGNYLLIQSDTDIPFKLLKQSAQRDKIRVAIQELTGKVYKLGPYKKPEETSGGASDPLDQLISNLKDNGIAVTEE